MSEHQIIKLSKTEATKLDELINTKYKNLYKCDNRSYFIIFIKPQMSESQELNFNALQIFPRIAIKYDTNGYLQNVFSNLKMESYLNF